MAEKKRYGFVIDVSRCIDCRACLVACRVENEVALPHTRIWVRDQGLEGTFPDLARMFVPYNCMHCEHPLCIEVCTSGATYKDPDNGLVLVDQEACIGCGLCVEACPYDARYLDPARGVVDKCTGCVQRVERGEQPACVATCLGGARMFGDLNDPNSQVSQALSGATKVRQLVTKQVDPDPSVYYINGDVMQASLLPRLPRYTMPESLWRTVAVPSVIAGITLSFLGQAVAFTKQLIEGEEEFEE